LSENRVLFIVGPTAVGKTELSLQVAERLGGEIVSADSRQVYRFMDIGTAKPTPRERERIPHHFIDIRTPDQYYSAGEYGHEARLCIAQLLQRGVTPVVVGGSGFYIQALVDGLFAPGISDAQVKQEWRRRIQEQGLAEIFLTLQSIDPETARRLHPNDEQRIVRALEVYELTGMPISRFRQGPRTAAHFTPLFVGLTRERQALYRRIEARVDDMIALGLVDEVRGLQNKGWTPQLTSLRTVGYREVFDYLAGLTSFQDMLSKIKMNSRRYAKRQITWFRRDARIFWMDIGPLQAEQCVVEIMQLWKEKAAR